MSSDISDEERPVVFIGTPLYGGQGFAQFFDSVLNARQLLGQVGITSIHQTLRGESLITRGRMTLVADFLVREDFTHLIFIDGDLEFPADTLLRLLRHGEKVVCGAYPLKGYPIDYVTRTKKGAKTKLNEQGDAELVELTDAGTGMMCIHRSVFEEMKTAYPELQCRLQDSRLNQYGDDLRKKAEEEYWAFFDTMLVDPDETGKSRYLSEDYAFCRRWRDTGGSVFLDPSIPINHVGAHTFHGDLNALANSIGDNENE